MKNVTKLMIALVVVAALGFACSKYPGFKKDNTGLYYKFYVVNKKEIKPQIGDIVELTYTLRIQDSVLIDNVLIYDQIVESLFSGDVYAALQKMHLADSATFIMNGDTFFHYFMGQPFPFEKKDLYFDIKLNKITLKEEYEQQQREQEMQREEMIEQARFSEDSLIKDYVDKNQIKVKPTTSGLYFVKNVSGKGKMVKNGSKIKVHYTGKLLDGTVFDSSVERGEPIDLTAGAGMVIPGWEEALLLMRTGDKAIVLIPSSLAYGSRGAGYAIPPYTPIVFDMEIISVE
jgi:FKBP-type peptidyl-prolyl cis-trans isomerase